MAKALFNRGLKYSQRNADGDWERAVKDYTRVIELAEAPPEEVAKALVNRGVSYAQRDDLGDRRQISKDLEKVIEMDGVSEPVRMAASKLYQVIGSEDGGS